MLKRLVFSTVGAVLLGGLVVLVSDPRDEASMTALSLIAGVIAGAIIGEAAAYASTPYAPPVPTYECAACGERMTTEETTCPVCGTSLTEQRDPTAIHEELSQ